MSIKEFITFDDVLIIPKFSYLKSRKEVDISPNSNGLPNMRVPIISANMDTITGPDMCITMAKAGGIGCLHRFWSIEDNIKAFKNSLCSRTTTEPEIAPIVSIGLGSYEFERAEALIDAGATHICIDVAHGAQIEVAKQFNRLAEKYNASDIHIIVGNFASGNSVRDFRSHTIRDPDAFKIGIGPGSSCITRIKTGCGYPQLSAIIDCVNTNPGINFIADGGMRTSGDIAKALAAGAVCVMLGGMLAGTLETPGELIQEDRQLYNSANFNSSIKAYKKYRGSASKESYVAQGKVSDWRATEGESFLVEYKGSVKSILQDIEGGIRSAFTYVGAANLKEFHEKAEFIRVSNATIKENGAHGKL